jgi:hypothetical protein
LQRLRLALSPLARDRMLFRRTAMLFLTIDKHRWRNRNMRHLPRG